MDSLQAFCNGKQWLGGRVSRQDGHQRMLEPEDERTYQAMLVAAILKRAAAPHNQTLYLRREVRAKRNSDTRYACVSAEEPKYDRLEILPQCPANRRFTASAVVQYEGNAAHLREPDGVPYNWTFSKTTGRRRVQGSPTTTPRRRVAD